MRGERHEHGQVDPCPESEPGHDARSVEDAVAFGLDDPSQGRGAGDGPEHPAGVEGLVLVPGGHGTGTRRPMKVNPLDMVLPFAFSAETASPGPKINGVDNWRL